MLLIIFQKYVTWTVVFMVDVSVSPVSATPVGLANSVPQNYATPAVVTTANVKMVLVFVCLAGTVGTAHLKAARELAQDTASVRSVTMAHGPVNASMAGMARTAPHSRNKSVTTPKITIKVCNATPRF